METRTDEIADRIFRFSTLGVAMRATAFDRDTHAHPPPYPSATVHSSGRLRAGGRTAQGAGRSPV